MRQFAPQFSEIASIRTVKDLSDEKLLERLTLLCGHLNRVGRDMSEAFSEFNKKGLRAQSFSKYGDKLLDKAGEVLENDAKYELSRQRVKSISDF